MPEHDDNGDGHTQKRDVTERRFWRSLASDKRPPSGTDAAPGTHDTLPGPQEIARVGSRAMSEDEPPVKGADAIDLTPGDEQRLNPEERAARREALRSMLHRSEARHRNTRRKRRPVLTAGSQVRVVSGPYVGKEGTILDADYIESRVLLALTDHQTPTWVSFDQVAGPSRKN